MMKSLYVFFFLLLGVLIFSACEKTEIGILNEPIQTSEDFVVPEIPIEIEELMNQSDVDQFKSGPGVEYLNAIQTRKRHNGRWHPVLMRLGYQLQIAPIGGGACEPGQFYPCFGPGAPPDPTDCLANIVGAAGITTADGYWLGRPVHSVFYPVFCLPDYAGFGSGFHEVNNDRVALEAQNSAFNYDDEGNSVFYRFGHYLPQQSTGVFEGAFGWEVARMFTAYEDSPSNPTNNGQGFSFVIIFGWVYY